MSANKSTTTTIPKCPDWCELPAGHDYDSKTHEGDTLVRIHERTFGALTGAATGADICQPEHAESPTGPIRLGPAEITVWVRGNVGGEGLSADEAAQLAARLVEAAAALDALS